MDKLPACSNTAASCPISGDAVSDHIEPIEFFNIEMDHLARALALITTRRHRWRHVSDARELHSAQYPADCARRQADPARDLLAGHARAAQINNLLNERAAYWIA